MITNEMLRIIKQRRSIRRYKKEQIRDEELQAVLEAGLYAPNAGGEAWHFTVIQKKEILDKINNLAKEHLKSHVLDDLKALGNDEEYNGMYGAPTLIIVSAYEEFIPLDADCAAATQNMLVAAESIGLGSCWIYFTMFAFESPQGDDLRKELKIPEGYKPYTSLLLGYKDISVTEAPERKPDLITYIK
ncbi:nitroreductase family protein [Clostridium sp.]|uniref:nitroreductase family protein n=1 Tax=Clostridium sp. TaxID=1506 RepID=UPI002FCB0AC8